MAIRTAPDMRGTVTSELMNIQAATETTRRAVSLSPGARLAQSGSSGRAASPSLSVRAPGCNEIELVREGMPVDDTDICNVYPHDPADGDPIDIPGLAQGSSSLTARVVNVADEQIDTGEICLAGATGHVGFSDATGGNALGPSRRGRRHIDVGLDETSVGANPVRPRGFHVETDQLYDPNPALGACLQNVDSVTVCSTINGAASRRAALMSRWA